MRLYPGTLIRAGRDAMFASKNKYMNASLPNICPHTVCKSLGNDKNEIPASFAVSQNVEW